MRKTAVRMFIRGFIQSFFIVAILLSVGVLSYKLTMNYWQAPEEVQVAYQEETLPESIIEATVDDISKNLIYCYDEDTKKVTKMVLEIFHCGNNEITYITIPMRTKLTLSDDLYQKLILVHPAMPQILQLSAISSYLDYDTVFDYGVFMVEELLDIQISYYTAIPKDIYDKIFISKSMTSNSKPDQNVVQNNEAQLPVECFSDEYIKFIKKMKTSEDISNYIEELYPDLRSNLSVFDKLNYLESYMVTSVQDISFELVQGEDTNSGFLVDLPLAASRFHEITKDKTSGN